MVTVASDNPFPSALFVESAAPATPGTGTQRLFVDTADGLLKLIDDTGTVSEVGGGSAAAHIADTSAAHVASSIGFTPNGSIAATDVQAAIQEVRDEAGGGFTDPMTTRGDIIVRDSANATARLAIGSSGKVLSSDGTDVSWQTPAGAGAWTWIERKTASASSALDFQALSTGTYDTHVLIFSKIVMSGNNALWVRVGTTGSFTIDTGANYDDDQWVWRAGGQGGGGAAGQTKWRLTYTASTPLASSTLSWNGMYRLYMLGDTTAYKFIEGRLVHSDTGFRVVTEMRGNYNSATAVTALQVLPASGTITSGTVDLYGIKHA